MSIVTEIAQTLAAWPELAGATVRPDKRGPNDAPPYVIFQKISGRRIQSLAGDSGLANPQYQFDVYAASRLVAESLGSEVRKAIQANPVLGAVYSGEGAGFEDATKLCREMVAFSLWYYD